MNRPTPPTVRCEDQPFGPNGCECQTLFGVTSEHLTPHQKDDLVAWTNDRELALTELMVRVVASALRLDFTEEQVRTVVVALTSDEGRFDGVNDTTVAELPPENVLDQIRLYGDLTG